MMTAKAKSTRGRRDTEPVLFTEALERSTVGSYVEWKALQAPMLERLLVRLLDEEQEWSDYEAVAATASRRGADVRLDVPDSLYRWMRGLSNADAAERADVVAKSGRFRMPAPSPTLLVGLHGQSFAMRRQLEADAIRWLGGEALARGAACDYASAKQLWAVFAELLLRACDCGEILVKVCPELRGRRARRGKNDSFDVKNANADAFRSLRRRKDEQRSAFGYAG